MAYSKDAFKTGLNTDPGKFLKLAQRVEQAMQDHLCLKEPKQLDPQMVLVAPMNRDRAPPNILHIHLVILKSFITKGSIPESPKLRLCVRRTSRSTFFTACLSRI